jgi:ribosomal protein S1
MMRNGNGMGGQFRANGDNAGNRMMFGRGVVGEVTAIDDKSMTVKMPDGSSKIVILSESAKYNQSTEAKKADVKVGTNVMVSGKDNTDGSITAESINLNPQFRNQTSTPTKAN